MKCPTCGADASPWNLLDSEIKQWPYLDYEYNPAKSMQKITAKIGYVYPREFLDKLDSLGFKISVIGTLQNLVMIFIERKPE